MGTSERLTRDDRRRQTRADLVATARRVFLRRGFHGASLEEIAREAGYTKGAVYSNFESKDDLFLGVLDEHYDRRAALYREVALAGDTPEDTYGAVARFFLVDTLEREPRWIPLLAEFTAHASRHPPLRRGVAALRDRFLDAIAALIEDVGERHGLRYRLPAKQVALGSSAVMRGLALERQLAPEVVPPELFEEIHTAYMRGLTQGPARQEEQR